MAKRKERKGTGRKGGKVGAEKDWRPIVLVIVFLAWLLVMVMLGNL